MFPYLNGLKRYDMASKNDEKETESSFVFSQRALDLWPPNRSPWITTFPTMVLHSLDGKTCIAKPSAVGGDKVLTEFWIENASLYENVANKQIAKWGLAMPFHSPAVSGIYWQPGYNIKIAWHHDVCGFARLNGQTYRFRKSNRNIIDMDDDLVFLNGTATGPSNPELNELHIQAIAVIMYLQGKKFKLYKQSYRGNLTSFCLPTDKKEVRKDELYETMKQIAQAYQNARTQNRDSGDEIPF